MNATYVALGALFIILGVAQMARGKKLDDPAAAKGKRMSGIFFIMAGLIFIVTGIISGSDA